jgi:hypothetical protein
MTKSLPKHDPDQCARDNQHHVTMSLRWARRFADFLAKACQQIIPHLQWYSGFEGDYLCMIGISIAFQTKVNA